MFVAMVTCTSAASITAPEGYSTQTFDTENVWIYNIFESNGYVSGWGDFAGNYATEVDGTIEIQLLGFFNTSTWAGVVPDVPHFRIVFTLKNGDIKQREKINVQEYGYRFNIWEYATGKWQSTKDDDAFKHPAIFPEKLVADHIMTWTNENDIVYDPFMGSGTTAKMAKIYNRNFIGSEISVEYCKIANKRIEPYLKQVKLL